MAMYIGEYVAKKLTSAEAHKFATTPSLFLTPTDHAVWCGDPRVFFHTHEDATEFLHLHPDLRMFEGAERVDIIQSFLGYTFAPVGKKTRLYYPAWALPKSVFPEEEIPKISEDYIFSLCTKHDELAFDRVKYLACCRVASKGKIGVFRLPKYYNSGSECICVAYRREDQTYKHFVVDESGWFDWDTYLHRRYY